MDTRNPVIALTPGEPAGIGPDLCVLHAQEARPDGPRLVAIADPGLLRRRAARLGLPLQLRDFDPGAPPPLEAGVLEVRAVSLGATEQPGVLDPANADYVLQTLDWAVAGCLDGSFDALVTGPVQKSVINDAGIAFTGHTEYLAEKCRRDTVVMMLATEGLRVALATTHLPLRAVADAISRPLLLSVLHILNEDLKTKFGIARPRILVSGLNPHAGEGGHLGREEIEIIAPAIGELRSAGLDVKGPLPADTLFTPRHLNEADAVLAMYHDQGLPVLKYKGFGSAVNITLGLPMVRTSVDHGTALDLAGTGGIDTGSFKAAVTQALAMAGNWRGTR